MVLMQAKLHVSLSFLLGPGGVRVRRPASRWLSHGLVSDFG